MKRNSFDEMLLKTRGYSVLVSNETSNDQGSGLLYYPGSGEQLYVFTCAHVVDGADKVRVSLLIPAAAEQGEYDVCHLTAPKEQIYFSPLDQKISDGSGGMQHSHDVAVIVLYKDRLLALNRTVYCVAEAEDFMQVCAQGYPGGRRNGEDLLFALDHTEGKIKTVSRKNQIFEWRIENSAIDPGDRETELQGFSGSPVWEISNQEQYSVVGLMTAGKRTNVFRGIVQSIKMRYVQSIMKNRFGITMETTLPWIPEEDIADGEELRYDGTLPEANKGESAQDAWLTEQRHKVRALIDDMKISDAIDLCRQLLEDSRFSKCSEANRMLLAQHLMYCYDTCGMEQEAEALEQWMQQQKWIEKHDANRWLTKLFSLQRYEDVLAFAQTIPKENPSYNRAKFFSDMARAFVYKAGAEETVGLYVDETENLRKPTHDADTDAFYLQIIGYVYVSCYRMPEKAIRCLNRAYKINHQAIVCETLAGAYFHLAIKEALDERGQIVQEKIDRDNLYKARACFLIIIDQEDELCFRGAIQRMGWEIYHTFVLLRDSYRVLTLYPMMKKYFPFKNQEDRRSVERDYANIVVQGGTIDFGQFSALTQEEREMFQAGADMNGFLDAFEMGNLLANPETEQVLNHMIQRAENTVQQTEGDIQLTFRRSLMLLYRIGTYLFKKNYLDKMQLHLEEIQKTSNRALINCMEQIVYECGHTYAENVRYFEKVFREAPSMNTWTDLVKIHIRSGNLDQAEEMYQDLLENHRELYQEAPEYAYRAYLDFICIYHRDLKNALKCFLAGKEWFLDRYIKDFWELDLKERTFDFNDPDKTEEKLRPFMEKGLLPADDYYYRVFRAYLENLDGPKTDELFVHLPHRTPNGQWIWAEVKYLAWRKRVKPGNYAFERNMMPEKVETILRQFENESGVDPAIRKRLKRRFELERICVLDAWTFYLLAVKDKLNLLEGLDQVYVTHMTVDTLLNEIVEQTNKPARKALDFIEGNGGVQIISASFEWQIAVRDKVFYDESAGAAAVALEKKCVAVIGNPAVERSFFSVFSADAVRPTELFGDLNKIKANGNPT